MKPATLIVVLLFATAAAGAEQKPNVVLIVVDTLRRDHVGCYGYGRPTTPSIDKVAKEGARFDQCIAPSSWTIPSLTTLFTSLPPSVHRLTSYERKLPENLTTLAAELKKAGYQTVGAVSNPSASAKFGFGRGFDLYDDYTVMLSNELNFLNEPKAPQSIRALSTSPSVNRVALEWLKGKRDPTKPFFLFLLYLDPHADYVPPEPYSKMFDPDYKGAVDGKNMYDQRGKGYSEADREHTRALYDGEVRYVDEHIGHILKWLDDQQLTKETMVAITSDHGEEFWEHGGMFHGHTLHDELIRVPLVMRWPGTIKPGTVVKAQTGLHSLMPTLLNAAGIEVPAQCQGRSLLPSLTTGEEPAAGILFSETETEGHSFASARTEDAKIILNRNTGTRQVFDLKADPLELKDLAPNPPAWFKDLSGRLDDWNKRMEEQANARDADKKAELDEKLLEQLKQMGYVH